MIKTPNYLLIWAIATFTSLIFFDRLVNLWFIAISNPSPASRYWPIRPSWLSLSQRGTLRCHPSHLSRGWLKHGSRILISGIMPVNVVLSWTGVGLLLLELQQCYFAWVPTAFFVLFIYRHSSQVWFPKPHHFFHEPYLLLVPRGAVEANAAVLTFAAEKWVEIFDFVGSGSRPRTLPLKLVVDQVTLNNLWFMFLFMPQK